MRGKLLRSLLVSGVFLLVYTYRLGSLFSWDTDWSRDLYDTAKLASGDVTLIGPALTGAVFAGPYYYYSMVPQLRLSGFNENAILYANAIMFAAIVGVISFALGVWAAFFIGLMPFWVLAARHPGNAYSYLPLLLLLLITAKLGWKKNILRQLEWGLLAGLVANFHPVSVIVIFPIGLWKSWRSRNVGWLFTFGLTYLPIMAFELKHKFVISQAVLSGKFLSLVTSKTAEAVQWHYLLPIFLFVTYIGIIYFANKLPIIVKATALIALIIVLPVSVFKPSNNSNPSYEDVVKGVINSGLIKTNVPFNILGFNDEKKQVVSANEFRYYLLKNGYNTLTPDSFAVAENVIIFSKLEIKEISQIDTWEMKQFTSKPKIAESQTIKDYFVYKITKN